MTTTCGSRPFLDTTTQVLEVPKSTATLNVTRGFPSPWPGIARGPCQDDDTVHSRTPAGSGSLRLDPRHLHQLLADLPADQDTPARRHRARLDVTEQLALVLAAVHHDARCRDLPELADDRIIGRPRGATRAAG